LHPKFKIQRIENLNISFELYHNHGLPLVGISAEDILDRNQKLILALIWQLIAFYHIKRQKEKVQSLESSMHTELLSDSANSEFSDVIDPVDEMKRSLSESSMNDIKSSLNKKELSPQKEFINWLNSVGIPVYNLTTDFQNGENMCKLINLLEPGLFQYDKKHILDTVNTIIETALNKFAIPRILDPSDIIETPNYETNLTYFSYFREKYFEKLVEKSKEEKVMTKNTTHEIIPQKKRRKI